MEDQVGRYKTDDPALVSWLRYNDFDPLALKEMVDNFFVWVFEDGNDLRDCIEIYVSGDGSVEPKQFALIIRETHRELSSKKRPYRARTA